MSYFTHSFNIILPFLFFSYFYLYNLFLFSVDIYLFIAYCIGHCVFIYISRSLCVFFLLFCVASRLNEMTLHCPAGVRICSLLVEQSNTEKKLKTWGRRNLVLPPLILLISSSRSSQFSQPTSQPHTHSVHYLEPLAAAFRIVFRTVSCAASV